MAAAPVSLPLPEMDPLSPSQTEQVREFERTVILAMRDAGTLIAPWAALTEEDRRILAYKFLVARKWDAAQAKEMFISTVAMKKKLGFDVNPIFPAAIRLYGYDVEELSAKHNVGSGEPRPKNDIDRIRNNIQPVYPLCFHKWDKWGHPVYWERTGQIRAKGLVERFRQVARVGSPYTQPCIDYHLHVNEVGMALSRYNDEKFRERNGGRRVTGIVVIMDCEGLGYGSLYKPALELLKVCSAQDAAHYPEGLHHLFVVNCPSMVTFAWSIVKGWVEPRVQKKLEFLGPDKTKAKLLEWIDAENLPEQLGGTAKCDDMKVLVGEELNNASMTSDSTDPLAETIAVAAGAKTFKILEGDVNDTFVYEFQVEEYNVVFSAHFHSDDGNEIEIFGASKVGQGADKFQFPAKGKITLIWNNDHSWMRGKKLTLRVFKDSSASAPQVTPQNSSPGLRATPTMA